MEKLYEIFLKHPKICTDTRNLEKNSVFFALKGPQFNANSFAKKALESGCACAVIDDEKFNEGEKYILVENTLTTLQNLAKHHRIQLTIPIIGITGSNGKTTTKELIYEILSKKYKTLATDGNLNNHIGVPLTVLSITSQHEMAIVEMGANHIGEIAELCSISMPDFGIITNIGKAHLAGFESFDGVIKAKSELYDFLKKNNGTVFLNNDNQLLKDLANSIKKITYGKSHDSDVAGKFLDANPFVNIAWKKKTEPDFREYINTKIIGSYNFENILAAICIGNFFGVEKEKIKDALELYQPSNNRSQLMQKGSNTIILDCYNANPVSMAAAVNNFAEMNTNKKIAILGDMLELGEYSEKEHESIVELLKNCGFSKVFLVGKEFSKIPLPGNFKSFLSVVEAGKNLSEEKIEKSQILIKGSRAIKLESVLDYL